MKLIKTTDNGLLKFNTIDLYSSTSVAKELGTTHQKVLKAIVKARDYVKSHSTSQFSENAHFSPRFIDSTYINERGREYSSVNMNLDGAKVLVKMIDTQKAYNLFAMLMSEFNKMSIERNERADSKQLQRAVTDSLQELHRRLNKAGSTQVEVRLYETFNKKCVKAVTGQPYHKNILDTLDARQACDLAELRDNSHKQLDAMLEGTDTPQDIRKNLWSYISGFNA